LLVASFLFGLLFVSEDGDSTFVRNVGGLHGFISHIIVISILCYVLNCNGQNTRTEGTGIKKRGLNMVLSDFMELLTVQVLNKFPVFSGNLWFNIIFTRYNDIICSKL
jgi:hypothetical protein